MKNAMQALIFAAVSVGLVVWGGGLLYNKFLPPLRQVIAARSWSEVPCQITSIAMEEFSFQEAERVKVEYAYEVGGARHTGNRYAFMVETSKDVPGQLPVGTRTSCWVNPEDANDSVLRRDAPRVLFFGLVPLALLALGLVGVGALVMDIAAAVMRLFRG